MNCRTASLAAVILLAALAVAVLPSGAEAADDTYDKEFYCYGDNPVFSYERDNDATVTWKVLDEATGEEIPHRVLDSRKMTVDLSAQDGDVVVLQTVAGDGVSDTQAILVHPMHVSADEDGMYRINFWDGGNLLNTQVITGTTHVAAGDDFFVVPAEPVKEGFGFIGWYADPNSFDSPVDPGTPVTDDLDLYARWSGGSGGGTHTVVVEETHVVTFEMVNGLRYDIVSVGDDSVSFVVSVADGYTFDMSTISVSSDSGSITRNGDAYILSGIDSDVVVKVTGNRLFSVDYRLSNAEITVPGYEAVPTTSITGSFEAVVGSAFGWAGLDITVLMGGQDVTSECLKGDSVIISDVTGDIVIIADSTIPWVYILVVVVIAVVAVVAFLVLRRRRDRS